MKKLILQGIIKMSYEGQWPVIVLVQEDGYGINLINRMAELNMNAGNKIQVNYHIAPERMTEIQLKEILIKTISGALEAEYQANGYHYSSWTSGTDYDTVLTINGHNLYRELSDHADKFLFMEINYHPDHAPF